jgi:hypothetical protein
VSSTLPRGIHTYTRNTLAPSRTHAQDVLEEIDPILEPVLAKSFIKRGNQTLIKLGDKEVDYNFDFKLYITTKLANPHYTPEISTKVGSRDPHFSLLCFAK